MPIRLDPKRASELAKLISELFSRDELDEVLRGDWYKSSIDRLVGNEGTDVQFLRIVEKLNRDDKIEEFCAQLVAKRLHMQRDFEEIVGALAATPAAAGPFNPFEFLDHFDRNDERDLVAQQLRDFAAPPPLKPVIIGILAELDDEYTYLVNRLNADVLKRLSPDASWAQEVIGWSKTATAEYEMRKIAYKKLGTDKGEIGPLMERLAPAIAGRTLIVEFSSDAFREPATVDKLAEFLVLWSRFGVRAPPPLLYVVVVRYGEDGFALEAATGLIGAAFARSGAELISIQPFALSWCEPNNFQTWQEALTILGKKINPVAFDRLKRSIAKPRFRLRELMIQLEQSQRFYS